MTAANNRNYYCWAVGLILLISLLLRLAFVAGIHVELHSDMATYHHRALDLLQHGSFGHTGGHYFEESVYRLPLYPVFLAIIYKLAGPNPSVVYVIQAFIGTLLLWGVYLLTSRVFDNRLAGLWALIAAALYSPLIGYCGILLTETLFMTLSVFAVYAWFRAVQESRMPWVLGAGVLFGLAALTRSIIFPFPFMLALWLLIFHQKLNQRFATALRYGAVLVATTLLVISPWTVRNYMEYNKFIPLDSLTGLNLIIGNNDKAKGGFVRHYSQSPEFQRAHAKSKNLVDLDTHLKTEVLGWIRRNPERYKALVLKRLGRYFAKEYDGYSKSYHWKRIPIHHNGIMEVYRTVWQYIAVGVLLIGLVRLNPWIIALGGMSVFFYVVPALFYYHARYRLPGVPLMMILGGLGVAWVCQWLWALRKRPAG